MILGRGRKLRRFRALVLESGLFDNAYYRAQGVDCGTQQPVDHYLETGWREGYDPSGGFSTLHYLATYPDVGESGCNPLAHYVEHGRHEGRIALPDDDEPSREGEVPSPKAPSLAEWLALAGRFRSPSAVEVDVIVPVYRGYSETLRCFYAVLSAKQTTRFRLVVVDDCGPNPGLRRVLKKLEALGLIDLVGMPENVGFVRSCNAGLARNPSRDVVLLNSDTEVYGDWLDRLKRAAYAEEKIATVTPFSNNAEICSYPDFVRNNHARLELDDAALDSLMAEVNRDVTVDIPTGVGFCMYVRRAALDAVGLLSEEHFGRGYGEENDLCLRAAEAGWRNLLAADVFVRHYGGRSFGAEKATRVAAAIRKVEYLHPGYNALIARFLARDPIRPCREAIDRVRLARRLGGRRVALFVNHNRGGGTERHAHELADRLEADGMPVLFCRPVKQEPGQIALSDPRTPHLPNLPRVTLSGGPDPFAAILRALNVAHLHLHQLVDFDASAGDFFRKAAQCAGCSYDLTLHDYFYLCPRITMIGRTGLYCGEPDLSGCERCAQGEDAPAEGRTGIWEWRERSERLLTGARKIFAPSLDVARRHGRYMPGLEITIRPHFGGEVTHLPRRAVAKPQHRTLVVIGAIGQHKGSALIHACADLARRSHPNLRFQIVGFTDRDDELRALGNVVVTGGYHDADLIRTLAEGGACAAWFPAVWPETFSYTLSAALAAGLMPVTFDFGAIAERVREVGWGELLPPSTMLRPDLLVERLASFPIRPPPARIATGARYADIRRDYYEAPAAWAEPARRAG